MPRLKMPAIVAFFVAISCGYALFAGVAEAQVEHRVRQGQSLARIARRYQVPVHAIASANRLRMDAQLQPGQILSIPAEGLVYVGHGDTLTSLARRYNVSIAELARANRLRPTATIRLGQELLLPGHDRPAATSRTGSGGASPRGWGRPRNPGIVRFQRVGERRADRIRLVDRQGRVRRPAIARVAALMRPRGERSSMLPHPRLLRLIARISDHFGGRTVHIVSGYRHAGGYTNRTSRHTQGHAMDLRVDGVPNAVLRDYCLGFDHVGVGYYPRSTFVHLDVRRQSATWVDWSRPGEAPRYARPGEGPPADPADDAPDPEGNADQALADAPAPERSGSTLAEVDEPPAEDEGAEPFDDMPPADEAQD